jgi:hypothetical protein
MITTEDIAIFDECSKKYVFSAWQTPRISLATALNDSLRVGLLSGDPAAAKNHLMHTAAEPGLAVSTPSIYDCAVHHAALIELITTYLLAGEGAWKAAPVVTINGRSYQPLSFVRPACLRRVVLCSRWDQQRALEETHSWRTVADSAALGLPMLINAIVIGSATKGLRPSVWTRGYSHPVSKDLRIKSKMKDGENFNSNWRRVYREQSSRTPAEWLHLMQADNAFDDVVQSVSVGLPTHKVHEQMKEMMDSIATTTVGEMRRSQCFKVSTCPYSVCCHSADSITPELAGWHKKSTPA